MRLPLFISAAAVLCLLVPSPAAAAAPNGRYTGDRVDMRVHGRTIQVIGIDFKCRRTRGRTSLSDIRLRRSRGAWRFSITLYGLATYRNDHPDENVKATLRGRFSRTGRVVVGRYRIRSPYCGSTGDVRFRAAR